MGKFNTDIDDAKNLSNVVRFSETSGANFWFAYREDGFTFLKDVRIARSARGVDWHARKLKDENIGVTPRTNNNPQFVVVGEEMLLFWLDSGKDQLLATRRSPDPNNPQAFRWSQYVECLDTQGREIAEPRDAEAALGAIALGDLILVTIAANNSRVEYYLFDPKDYNAGNNSWRATMGSEIGVGEINGLLRRSEPRLVGFDPSTAISYYSQGPDATYLVQALFAKEDNGKDRYLVLQLQLSELEEGIGLPRMPLSGAAVWWNSAEEENMTLTLDPAGRVVASFLNDDNDKAYKRIMNTSSFPGAWGTRTRMAEFDADENPVVFYQLGELIETTVGGKKAEQRQVTEWFLIQDDDDDDTFAISNDYGKVQLVYKFEQLNLTQESTTETVYVQGYVDGPAPVFDGMVDPESEVTYALTSEMSNSFEVATNVSVGVKTEGDTAPAVGAGVKWDISFNAGVGAAFGVQRGKSITENTIFQLEESGGNYLQRGLLRGSDIILTRDAYMYIPEGQVLPVTDAPTYTEIYLDIQPDRKREYDLGTVTVGNLESYTEAAWNERMTPLYPGVDNYVDEVVRPAAVAFRDGSATLRDTWTPGSPINNRFASTTETYLSASMTLETEVFAGVSGKFLGADASFMAGFTASIATTAQSVSTNGFGLSMSIDGKAGGPVGRYRVSAYLLKSRNDWVRELVHFQPGQAGGFTIEPEASCWKIMYVVDQIEYNDPIDRLDLDESQLQDLRGQGIETTQDLLFHLELDFPADLHRSVDADRKEEHAGILEALRRWDKARNVYPKG